MRLENGIRRGIGGGLPTLFGAAALLVAAGQSAAQDADRPRARDLGFRSTAPPVR